MRNSFDQLCAPSSVRLLVASFSNVTQSARVTSAICTGYWQPCWSPMCFPRPLDARAGFSSQSVLVAIETLLECVAFLAFALPVSLPCPLGFLLVDMFFPMYSHSSIHSGFPSAQAILIRATPASPPTRPCEPKSGGESGCGDDGQQQSRAPRRTSDERAKRRRRCAHGALRR